MAPWSRWLTVVFLTCVALALTAALIAGAASPAFQKRSSPLVHALLEPDLRRALADARPGDRLDIVVEMRQQASPALLGAAQGGDDPVAARRRLVEGLQAVAARSQTGVRLYLAARQLAGDVGRVTPLWILNGLAVHGARPDVVHELAARPDVALIRLDRRRQWIQAQPYASPSAAQLQWGVERVRADQVWASLGISGTGAVVATIDTGVDWTHPALQASYRGYDPKGFHQHAGNWFDATDVGAVYPVDSHGHGTHVMGTLVGADGIGVAPGARWIAVRAFDSDGLAYDSWLHAAFQWLLAPNGDPALAPDVVNNSWGNNIGTMTTFQSDLDALRAAGIFALFAAGNNGPARGTVGSPASLSNAFAVGATDEDDEVASFSSRGPSPWGQVRPHVAAPGVNIYSTLPGGAYGLMNGTSMAVPHAAGTAVLVLSARPGLNITQTAFVLTSTAVPLSTTVPNNDTGYGLVDAYAAVALAADAGLVSGTVHRGGTPIAGAMLQATPPLSGAHGVATTDAEGRYRLFLRAGLYDVTASAFGYMPATAHMVPVTTGQTTVRNLGLTPLPTGRVAGSIIGEGGEPVAATVRVLGTPVTTVAQGGQYGLELPAGDYVLEARAVGYRVVTSSVSVAVGEVRAVDLTLPASMRLLLVDSGGWYYEGQAWYYRQALDDIAYAYDERRLKHLPDDLPTITELLTYDLVIWSAPRDSPGLVGAGDLVYQYLDQGGNLLLSGQDVGYWDGGGMFIVQPYYMNQLYSFFMADNAPSRRVVCEGDTFFGGLDVSITGGSGADNQKWPDEIRVLDPDHATLACSYEEGKGAVVRAGFCSGHRALNVGFGVEAISTDTGRAAFMERALGWFESPRQAVGVEMVRKTSATLVAAPGEAVTHTFRLRNAGETGGSDQIQVQVTGADWATTVLSPSVGLDSCAVTDVQVRVEVPADAAWDQYDVLTVTARSTISPALAQTLVVTSKAPAPVLLVDDDRWYDQSPAYEAALQAAFVPYDRWEVTDILGQGSPSAKRLSWYPMVLWFNGYDWYDPIHPSELDRLTGYLDGGGRLFLSSQEYLYVIGQEALTRDYFGVVTHSETLSQTAVTGVPGHVLGDGIGPLALDYPFRNWSDSVLPAPGAAVAFRGQHGQPGALTNEGNCAAGGPACRWRTAFFAFPVEAFPFEERVVLVGRLVGWLSWLGRSDLRADRAVAQVGEMVGYTLTVRNDGPGPVVGAAVSNTLPLNTTLADGPHGGASYDPVTRRISWSGDLGVGDALTFTYRLQVTAGTGQVQSLNRAEFTLGGQGLRFEREAVVQVGAPDLATSVLTVEPATVHSATEVTVTLALRNTSLTCLGGQCQGADAPNASVEVPLPWTMRLVTGTLSVVGGGAAVELPTENRVEWEGPLSVGEPVTLSFRAVAPRALHEPTWAFVAARLEDGMGGAWERGDWLYAEPWRFYLPVVGRNGVLGRR